MGVTYKLKEEVVHFIINERQHNPLFSCRQLAEVVSAQFGLRLSKSSVHDVLRESGITTPRGRKPRDSFQIPLEKKKEIQKSLSKAMLKGPVLPLSPGLGPLNSLEKSKENDMPPAQEPEAGISAAQSLIALPQEKKEEVFEISETYEGAGKIFLKAALWDLGVFSEDEITNGDWKYYLTYASRIKVLLENGQFLTFDWRMPINRSVREAADSLINNVKPLIISKTSDDDMFKASMEAKEVAKIKNVLIVDQFDHNILEFINIVDIKRNFLLQNRIFVESSERDLKIRAKGLFFTQAPINEEDIEKIINFRGFDTKNKDEICVTLLLPNGYEKNSIILATEQLNNMFLRDQENRLLKVQIKQLE